MKTSRRSFIKQSSIAIAGAGIWSDSFLAPRKKKDTWALQLYSVRADMKADAAGTLAKVAAMGYKNVEHANYVNRHFYGYTPAEFKQLLSGLGLQMPSGHTVMKPEHWDVAKGDFTDVWKQTIDDAAYMGQSYVVSPWIDERKRSTYDDLLAYLQVFNKCGALCKKAGMKFGYHNHDFEFSVKLRDITVYDIILTNTDPDLVVQQLDMGNMYNAGAKALDIVNKYPGRFISMHVKDEIKVANPETPYESTVLGKGVIPVREIIDLGKKSGGTTLFIIEQESYQDSTALESIQQDLNIIKRWRYA